jgi:hypothetical protein
VVGPDEGVVTESSAFPDTIRDGEGSGLLLDVGSDPRLVRVMWLIRGAEASLSAVWTDVIGAVEGVWDNSSVACVANFK